jgi:D-alanine-D-alanine ligase-like ATP-grasp enzyme
MTVKPSTASQSPLIERPVKVAVLMGGIGEERDISIQSGSCVAQALKEAGLDVVTSDVRPDNLDILGDSSIDVFFLALHGRFGEDGQLQQMLEDKGLCYTGSGPKASRLAFDKLAAKQCFIEADITTPKAIAFDVNTKPKEFENQLLRLSNKFVVKPVHQGSTIGVTIVDNPKSALAEARKCSARFGDCMIEEYILGLRHFARVDFILSADGTAYALEANSIPGLTSHSLLPKAAARMGLSMSDLCIKIIKAAFENIKTTYYSRKSE